MHQLRAALHLNLFLLWSSRSLTSIELLESSIGDHLPLDFCTMDVCAFKAVQQTTIH